MFIFNSNDSIDCQQNAYFLNFSLVATCEALFTVRYCTVQAIQPRAALALFITSSCCSGTCSDVVSFIWYHTNIGTDVAFLTSSL